MSEQVQPSVRQGMMSASAAALVYSDASTNTPSIVIRSAGNNPGTPSGWTTTRFGAASAIHPDYSEGKIYENWPTTTLPRGIAELSTGGDICPPVDDTGRLIMGNQWLGLSIMVNANATGVAGSLISGFSANPQRAAGNIFSYYAIGSVGISDAYIDRTFIEQTAAQLGYPNTAAGTVAGLDWGMGVISADPLKRSMPFWGVRDRIYFVVTKAFADANSTLTFIDPSVSSGPVPINAATVYAQSWTWDAVTGGTWSAPFVEYSYADLGLTFQGPGAQQNDAIDMLSVYKANGHDRVIFSTKVNPHNPATITRDQILVFQRYTGFAVACATTPLKTSTNVNISNKIGLKQGSTGNPHVDPDEVEGGCAKDPESGGLSAMIGIPMAQELIPLNPLGISVARQEVIDENDVQISDTIYVQANGLDLKSSPLGVVEFLVGLPDALGQTVWFHWTYQAVFPNQLTDSIALPGNLQLGISSIEFQARLYVWDTAIGQFVLDRESVISSLRYN